jgi:hypothetical protein
MKFLSVFVLILFFSAGYLVGHIVTAKDYTTIMEKRESSYKQRLVFISNVHSDSVKSLILKFSSKLDKCIEQKTRCVESIKRQSNCCLELRNTEDNLIRCVEQGQLN